jgi:hypothetical protein
MTTPEDGETSEMSPADAARWYTALTLHDLGELTAQWLEGKIASIPSVVPDTGPDEETIPLIPLLAAANRAGYFTEFSQPGEDDDGWIQRAAVSGFASPATFAALCTAAAHTDLMITVARAGDDDWGPTATVSIDNGSENTCTGGAMSSAVIHGNYGPHLHPDALQAICDAWQITLIDPQWGRNDTLWPVLATFAAQRNHGHDRTFIYDNSRAGAIYGGAQRPILRRQTPPPRRHLPPARRERYRPSRLRPLLLARRLRTERAEGRGERADRAAGP